MIASLASHVTVFFSMLAAVGQHNIEWLEQPLLLSDFSYKQGSGANTQRVTSCDVGMDEQEILELHNQARRKGGRCGFKRKRPMPKLTYSCQLASVSLAHSNDMFLNDFMSHIGSDKSNHVSRAARAGYQWRTLGENVAYGFKTAKEVHKVWLKSRGHCNNIMNKAFTEIGISRVGDYWTVTFGRP